MTVAARSIDEDAATYSRVEKSNRGHSHRRANSSGSEQDRFEAVGRRDFGPRSRTSRRRNRNPYIAPGRLSGAEKKRGGSCSPPSKRRVLGRNSESDVRYAFLGGQTDVISHSFRASKIPNPEWCLDIAD